MATWIPEGWHSVTPGLIVQDVARLVEFLKGALGAAGEFRTDRPCQMRLGDSLVMVSGVGPRDPMPAFLYLYVDDTDMVYQRALQAGAVALEEPTDTPYGDRRGMVQDPCGNVWQIATCKGEPETPRERQASASRSAGRMQGSGSGAERPAHMTVRPMRRDDSAAVALLAGQLGYPCTPAQVEQRFGRIAGNHDATVLVAHAPDDRILGWVHVSGTADLVSERHAEVRGLVVDAGARSQGVGRALLAAAERWATERGHEAMRVRSNTLRTEARVFYERAGYRITKTQNHFHKVLAGDRQAP